VHAGRRKTGVAVAATGFLAASLVAVVLAHGAASSSASQARQDPCSRHAKRVTERSARISVQKSVFEVPSPWYYVPVCFTTAAIVQPMGYFTTQHPVAQCRPASVGGGCGAPVDRLGPDDGLIVFSTVLDPMSRSRFTSTLGGHPARVKVRHWGRCDVALDAWIRMDADDQVWAAACLNGAQAERLGSVMQMLRSAVYR